jgi:hypothetical protein
MDQLTGDQATAPIVDVDRVGNVAAAVMTLARVHGITDAPAVIDGFANAVSRLSDADVELDYIERLLLALARAGIVDDRERFALHAVYLHQKA